ncbi:MAG TPA: lantibiotic dehydratase [Kofleriaceae bacterium]|jgi:thiopeptide-type bacteriocin biosynthesis protein
MTFVVRTPLLARDALDEWAAAPDPRAWLRARVAEPAIRNALYLASPSLVDGLPAWERDPDAALPVERALVRYLERMAARATPFGLFAGCGLGAFGSDQRDASHIRVAPREGHTHTRLDMDYAFALAAALAAQHRDELAVHPSTSLYRAGDRWRVVRSDPDRTGRKHRLMSVLASDYLDATLARARDGATPRALAAPLVDDEVTLDDALAFVHELIDAQLLVPDVAPAVTGDDPLASLRAHAHAHAPALERVSAAIAALDAAPLACAPEAYEAIARELEALPAKVERARLFQVDLVAPADAMLGPLVRAAIERAVALLARVAPVRPDPLAKFRAAYTERYGDAAVPLAEVLDDELGIGLPGADAADAAPLLDDVPAGDAAAPEPVAPPGAVRLRLLDRALRAGAREVELTDADVAELAGTAPRLPLPGAYHAMVALDGTPAQLAAGDVRIWIDHVAGPSGAALLGRFCLGDAALEAAVRAHLAAEEALAPDAIFAEVVHLPEGRVGNVLCRPVLRAFEIPFLGASGAPRDRQIPIADLDIVPQGERLSLWSRRLGREVIPRLTTAHNFYRGSIPLYRFLGLLQGQGVADSLAWDWGALDEAPFLPRVAHRGTVLARARWRLAKDECAGATAASLRARGWPRHVLLAEHDNLLPIDTENRLSLEAAAHVIKQRTSATILEHEPWTSPVTGPGGTYAHELVVPFVRGEPRAAKPTTGRHPRESFPPGSRWIYAKLYTGPVGADAILREHVAPLVAEQRVPWFFLRYGDPDWHLRVRFAGDRARICAALEAIPVRRLVYDTYDRELARYGGPAATDLVEQLFGADSDLVLACLPHVVGDDGLALRGPLAILGCARLLDDLGIAPADQLALVTRVAGAFAAEQRANLAVTKALGDNFRRARASLAALFAAPPPFAAAALDARSHALAPIAAALRSHVDPIAVAPSYLHMHCNRMLQSAHRAQELVVYDSLRRLLESRARRR